MKRHIPSLQSLMCFESAAKHASFSLAAQELCLSQSAVSRQIRHLEQYLGVQLFTRTRYGMQLTHAGNAYLDGIGLHLSSLEQVTTDLMMHKGLGGVLKLGVVPTFATRWLLPRLTDFYRQHPNVSIHFHTNTKPFLFTERDFDAVIFAGSEEQIRHWPGVKAHFLMSESVVLVCSPELIRRHFGDLTPSAFGGYELTAEQMLKLPLLQQSTRPGMFKEWFDAMQVDHPSVFEGWRHELFSMLAMAASQGMGLALIPRMLVEDELRAGILVQASARELQGSRAYYLLHPSTQPSQTVAQFATWLLDTIKSQKKSASERQMLINR